MSRGFKVGLEPKNAETQWCILIGIYRFQLIQVLQYVHSDLEVAQNSKLQKGGLRVKAASLHGEV